MRGYSLLEVLVATTIVAVGVAALAQLMSLATQTTRGARQMTTAAILAQGKLEEILPASATALAPSPADVLGHNVDGYSDCLDAAGRLLGPGRAAPAATAYVRRWSVNPMPGTSDKTIVVQVLVMDRRGRALARFVAATAAKAF